MSDARLALLDRLREDLLPQALDAVAEFLQPPVGDPNFHIRCFVAQRLEKVYVLRNPPYCCPETRLLVMMLCIIEGKDIRDDARHHNYLMTHLLERRLPCTRSYIREWPMRRAMQTRYADDNTGFRMLRHLARNMSRAWVVRLKERDETEPGIRIRACVMERG